MIGWLDNCRCTSECILVFSNALFKSIHFCCLSVLILLSVKFTCKFIAFGRTFCPAWLMSGLRHKIYSVLTNIGNYCIGVIPPTRFGQNKTSHTLRLSSLLLIPTPGPWDLTECLINKHHTKNNIQQFRLDVTQSQQSFIKKWQCFRHMIE